MSRHKARSVKRPSRQRSCGDKRKFASKQAALDAIYSLKRNQGATWMDAYRCSFCKQPGKPAVWHIGHKRRLR